MLTCHKEHLRETAQTWMCRAHSEAPFLLPDPATVQRYESTLIKQIGPSFDRATYKTHPLLVDVTSPHTSVWNTRCSRLFAKEYVQIKNARCIDVKKVMTLFQGQIVGMKKAHLKIIRNQLPAADRAKLTKENLRQRERSRVKEVGFQNSFRSPLLSILADVCISWVHVG